MTLPVIPEKPQDWNIDVIDSLIQILSIESETFDFKGSDFNEKKDDLYKDICAMANTSGGYIVLGIGEKKTPDGKTLRFLKEGFTEGEEDKVNQRIANNVYDIEPKPSIEPAQQIYEENHKTFYTLIKINSINVLKPHFSKKRMQCYVRIGNTSQPAGRTAILNLFSDYREKKASVQGLKIAATFAKESLIPISNDLKEYDDARMMPPIDLQSLKSAVSSNEWLLSQKGLLGGHKGNDHKSQVLGAYYHLRELEILNMYLDIYNTQHFTTTKQQIKRDLCEKQFWCPGRQKVKEAISFLDGLISCAREYLDKQTY
jgi:hypothetical protein